jgi:hypothetical protein
MTTNEESLFKTEPYDEVRELCLCEHDKIIPRPGALYRFIVSEDCDECQALAKAYEE